MPTVLRATLLTLILSLGGCAVFDGMQPKPEESEAPAETTQEPGPATDEPTDVTDCQWEETRGIAELVSVDNDTGKFLFYPGEIEVNSAVQADWQSGQEFKSILKQPLGDNCPPARLDSLEPLEAE